MVLDAQKKFSFFLQAGSPYHVMPATLEYLSWKFGTIISRKPREEVDIGTSSLVNWPNLGQKKGKTLMDHCLWRKLKDRIYLDPKPKNVKQLKDRINYVSTKELDREDMVLSFRCLKDWCRLMWSEFALKDLEKQASEVVTTAK